MVGDQQQGVAVVGAGRIDSSDFVEKKNSPHTAIPTFYLCKHVDVRNVGCIERKKKSQELCHSNDSVEQMYANQIQKYSLRIRIQVVNGYLNIFTIPVILSTLDLVASTFTNTNRAVAHRIHLYDVGRQKTVDTLIKGH